MARHEREHGRDAERLYAAIWADAAAATGAVLSNLGDDRREARRGGSTAVLRGAVTAIDPPGNVRRLLDKPWTHERLASVGARVPRYREMRLHELGAAGSLLRELGGTCVVKPAYGTGSGWGVTCGVRSRSDLLLAGFNAARYSPLLLVEEQIEGDSYRVLVLDGEVLDVVRRGFPCVVGDGRRSVIELFEAENERRSNASGELGLQLLRPDLDSLLHLRGQGLSFRSILERDRRVTVKQSSSESSPDDSETVQTLHPALASEVCSAAEAVGLRLAGVDVVAPGVDRSLRESGGAIVEVNAEPGLRYHYQVRDRRSATPVARAVLKRALK
jgi:cyanophycin synthetase